MFSTEKLKKREYDKKQEILKRRHCKRERKKYITCRNP